MSGAARIAIARTGAQATLLAQDLQLPLCAIDPADPAPSCDQFDFYLEYVSAGGVNHLQLTCPGGEFGKPFCIDFVHGELAHRRQYGGGRSQPLARAVGLKGGANPRIVDATAGLGRDAFVLACLGAEVILLERSPVLAALLTDALMRAQIDPALDPAIPARMTLMHTNAVNWLRDCVEEQRPDVVYLDPMYPHRTKSALVKKEMRILRALVGDDDDAGELLAAALGCAKRRVVVKRPRGAEPVLCADNALLRPAAAITSENTRYDIYPIG